MAFESLSEKLQNTFKKLKGKGVLTEADINDAMKIAAAHAIADLVTPEKLSPDYIIPPATDPDVAPAVAAATARAAIESGIARNPVDPQSVAENLRKRLS